MPRLRVPALLLLCCLIDVRSGAAIVNISCVGDSITQGVGVTNPNLDSWPARLQWLCGISTNVALGSSTNLIYNWGVSGTTLLRQGDMPYWNQLNFLLSRSHPPPQIVVIMLGTNDSKKTNQVHLVDFYTNCVDLILSYTNNPRILICTPPPCFGPNTPGINADVIETNIAPTIRLIGTNLNLQVIDLDRLLAGHNEFFPDNVHPNAKGTAAMAAIIFTAIQGDTMGGGAPTLTINKPTATTALVKWPAGGAGWVLQTNGVSAGTNVWSVPNVRPVTDGTSMRATNTMGGQGTLFRLWNPSN